MQFKRLQDDSIESQDGRIVLYSLPRFLREIAKGDSCFICGAKPGTKVFDSEHVIPNWVLRNRGLHSGKISLPNNASFMYGRYTIPCCKDCNAKMATIFEDPVSDAFSKGWSGVTDLIAKDGGRLLWRWMALIFLKAHLKHRELRWHLNRNEDNLRIADTYDLTDLFHIHCIVRSFHTGAVLGDRVYGSILVCPACNVEVGEAFDFSDFFPSASIMMRIGEVIVLAVLNDSGVVNGAMLDQITQITGPLTMLQARELHARFSHWNLSIEPRPQYASNIDFGTGEYFIEAVIPDGFTLFNEPRVELFGGILHYFVREVLEQFGTDPEIIENVKRGHYSFLFNEDGTFLTEGGRIHLK